MELNTISQGAADDTMTSRALALTSVFSREITALGKGGGAANSLAINTGGLGAYLTTFSTQATLLLII